MNLFFGRQKDLSLTSISTINIKNDLWLIARNKIKEKRLDMNNHIVLIPELITLYLHPVTIKTGLISIGI